jgi:hypothetical protein
VEDVVQGLKCLAGWGEGNGKRKRKAKAKGKRECEEFGSLGEHSEESLCHRGRRGEIS